MRKKLIISLICLIGLVLFAGCAKNTPSSDHDDTPESKTEVSKEKKSEAPKKKKRKKDKEKNETAKENIDAGEQYYEDIYAPVLNEVRDVIKNGYDHDRNYDYISDGIMERVMYPGDDDLSAAIGYYIKDMNGDGIKELLIGENSEYEYGNANDVSYIYSGFTYNGQKPVCFLEGWARNRQHYMGDGHFFNTGSGGAMNTIFGEWHLDSDNITPVWDDYYFSQEDIINGGMAFYHNTTGSDDVSESKKLKISTEEFDDILDSYSYKIGAVAWMPVCKKENGGKYIVNTMTDDELLDIERKLNSIRYYGFLLSTYEDPRDIYWDEVFYVGAGFDHGRPPKQIEQAYLQATGEEEIYTDVTTLSGEDVREFVKSTTGYDYSEMHHPLDWIYLKEYDLYLLEHGDTNQTSVCVTGGQVERNEYTITYESENDLAYCVTFKDIDGTYQFISNLPRWFVEDPTNGGDIDQSTITDGMIIPDSDRRKLTEDELAGLNADELRIARNEIYARHGRIFSDKKLQSHFNGMDWYFPTVEATDFNEDILNEFEKYNLKLITMYEKKVK